MADDFDDFEESGGDKKNVKAGKDEDGFDDGGEWDDTEGGGWDDAEDDFVEDELATISKPEPKKNTAVGIKLYMVLMKGTLQAIRTKKTGADQFDQAAQIVRDLYLEYESQQAEKEAEKKREKAKPKTAGASSSSSSSSSSSIKVDTNVASTSGSIADAKKKERPKLLTKCSICFSDYEGSTRAAVMGNCGHSTACRDCWKQYVQHKIRDKDVTPWICCPEAKCFVPANADDICGSGVTTAELFQLASAYLQKVVTRNENWVKCKDCDFGFLVEGKIGTKRPGEVCGVCYKKQDVEKKPPDLDDEFKKMIQEKKIRPCPACKFMTLKEYGVCNVIQCASCSIWWNWATNATGNDSRELKEKARLAGNLWEPGELAFQQNLERTNPEEFKKLLERNGVKYNPNYVRGRG